MVRRRLVGVLCLAVAVLAVAACDPLATPTGAAPLRYRDDVFTDVIRTSDVVYGTAVDQTGARVSLVLDMYEPAGDTVTARPAIVWVHGGGFSEGDKRSPEIVDEATTFARKGYVTASIDYRLVDGGCSAARPTTSCVTAIVQAREDAQTAIRFLRLRASAYRIDTSRMAIGGSSAGAITALNVGYTPEGPAPGANQGFSSAVRAVQSISGAAIVAGDKGSGDAPALLFHNTGDPLVPYDWARATVDDATAAHLLALLRTWDGVAHVPYVEHRAQILEDTRNFFYSQLDLAHAAR